MTQELSDRSALDGLLTLYHPNVPKGNFLGDAVRRGENKMLAKIIVALGLATSEEVAAEFRKRDIAAQERSEAFLAARESQ